MGKFTTKYHYWTIEEYDSLYDAVPTSRYYSIGYNEDEIRSKLMQNKKGKYPTFFRKIIVKKKRITMMMNPLETAGFVTSISPTITKVRKKNN